MRFKARVARTYLLRLSASLSYSASSAALGAGPAAESPGCDDLVEDLGTLISDPLEYLNLAQKLHN